MESVFLLFLFWSLELDFNITTGTFLSKDTTTEFRVFYEIPRKQLTFVRKPAMSEAEGEDKFFAQFGVLFKLWNKSASGGKEWGDSWIISAPQDSAKIITGELSIKIEPGKYDFYTKIWDLNSQRTGEKKSKVKVESLCGGGGTPPPQSISSRRFVDNKFWVFEVYNFSAQPFELIYEMNRNQEVAPTTDTIMVDTEFVNPIKLELIVDSLGYGNHIITLYLGDTKIIDTLEIKEPFGLKDYEEKVEQLYYIADGKERKALLDAPISARDSLWKEFWRKKEGEFGVSGIEEEYFRRVDYANEHFSAVRKGWQTDRGRIYILLGEPDAIETYPFEIDQPPYEVWSYYFKGVELIFVDKRGFGDYELQTPYWDRRIYFK